MLSELGLHTEVVDVAGAVTVADPFHEGAYRTLMSALAASGRRYEALAAFDRLREALRAEYDADPEPVTRRLYRDLLTAGEPPDARQSTAGAPPGIPAPRAVPGQVTAGMRLEPTSFVRRRREIAEIVQALGRTRLLTLTGPGGAGKMRLGYQVAAEFAARYPNGVHVAELSSLSRSDLVPQTVASLFALPLLNAGSPEAALARQLVGRQLLLVLDNCEHLLEACARLGGRAAAHLSGGDCARDEPAAAAGGR